MGSSASCTRISGKMVTSKEKPTETPTAFISEEHIDLVTQSWNDVQLVGAEKIGEITFKGLFLALPETFYMFHAFCEDPNWEESPKFKHHCKVVVNVIGSCIKILRNPQLIRSHLNYLGFQHNFRNIDPQHFGMLGIEFMKALQGTLIPLDKWNEAYYDAWLDLYTNISSVMIENMTDPKSPTVHIPKGMVATLPHHDHTAETKSNPKNKNTLQQSDGVHNIITHAENPVSIHSKKDSPRGVEAK